MITEAIYERGYLHPRKKCECGQVIADIKSSLHFTGVRHRRYKTVVRLLNSTCLNYSDIAERLGVSRERIRQIASSVTGKTTRERRGTCFVSRAFQLWRAHPNTQFLLQRGFDVRPVMRKMTNRHYAAPSTRMFRIGNKKILVNEAWNSTSLPGRAVSICPTHKTTLAKVELVASRSPFGVFIFPANDYPSKGTTFVVEPKQKPGGKRNRHDWPKYREAWHLITASAAVSPSQVPAN